MTEVRELHEAAMEHAERALFARLRGDSVEAAALLGLAFENERRAAELLSDRYDDEPTRSVLYRSAAALALDCNQPRAAEQLIAAALAGNPPPEIAGELRDLFERANFSRHLDLHGIELQANELQMSLTGNMVSAGMAQSEDFVYRLQGLQKLFYRTFERFRGKPYRDSGGPSRVVREYSLFVSAPRPGSFAVSLRVGGPAPRLPQLDDAPSIIDELMSCMDLFNKSADEALRERIGDDAYFRNFIGLARNIAPDGDEVRTVNFTARRDNSERRVSLTRVRDQISLTGDATRVLPPRLQVIRGQLRFADALTGSQIRIRMEDGTDSRPIHVLEGMSDIVRPLWEDFVEVTAEKDKRRLVLRDISRIG